MLSKKLVCSDQLYLEADYGCKNYILSSRSYNKVYKYVKLFDLRR